MTGDELRAYRLSRQLPQSKLAGELGVTANTVARWERGERAIPAAIARAIDTRQDRTRIIADLEARLRARDDEIRTLKATIKRKRRPTRWELFAELLEGKDTEQRAAAIYRRLVRKYHPDRQPQHAEVMADINELWQAAMPRQ